MNVHFTNVNLTKNMYDEISCEDNNENSIIYFQQQLSSYISFINKLKELDLKTIRNQELYNLFTKKSYIEFVNDDYLKMFSKKNEYIYDHIQCIGIKNINENISQPVFFIAAFKNNIMVRDRHLFDKKDVERLIFYKDIILCDKEGNEDIEFDNLPLVKIHKYHINNELHGFLENDEFYKLRLDYVRNNLSKSYLLGELEWYIATLQQQIEILMSMLSLYNNGNDLSFIKTWYDNSKEKNLLLALQKDKRII